MSQIDGSDDELVDGDCDYVFMQEYREKRIQQMTQNDPSRMKSSASVPTSVSLLHAPQFGECINSGGEGWFIKEIEEEDKRVTVVVHIYQEEIPACSEINKHLDEIAPLWPHIKFVKLPAYLSGVAVKAGSLPIISTYRRGELLAVIKDFAEDLLQRSDHCSREDVECHLLAGLTWRKEAVLMAAQYSGYV